MASPTARIAGALNVNLTEAQDFAEAVRAAVGFQVKYHLIADILAELPTDQRSVAAVVEQGDLMRLATHLDVSLTQVRAAVADIEAQVGFPASVQELLGAVERVGPEVTAEKVADYLYNHSILEELAAALDVPRDDAEYFANDISKGFVVPVSYADLLEAVQDLGDAPKTVPRILDRLELNVMAGRLAISKKEAAELPSDLEQLTQLPVDRERVLSVIAELGTRATLDRVIEHFVDEAEPVRRLASALEMTPLEARDFAASIRNSVKGPVGDEELLEAVQDVEGAPKTVQTIVDQLNLYALERGLGLEKGQAPQLLAEIQRDTGYDISSKQLLRLHGMLQDNDSSLDVDRLKAGWYIARDGNLPFQTAFHLVERVRQAVPDEAPYCDVLMALQAARSTALPRVVEHLERILLARALKLEEEKVDTLTDEIEEAIGRPVSPAELLQVTDKLQDEATAESVTAHIVKEAATVLAIAAELDLSPREAREAIARIQDASTQSLTEEAILQVIQTLDEEQKTVDATIDEFHLRSLAAEMGVERADIASLRNEIAQTTGKPTDSEILRQAFATVTDSPQPLRDTAAVVKLVRVLDRNPDKVKQLVSAVREDAEEEVTLDEILDLAASLEPSNRTPSGIATCLSLAETAALELADVDKETLNEVVNGLKDNDRKTKRFERLCRLYGSEAEVSIRDLKHMLELAGWHRFSIDLMAPPGSRDGRWITQRDIERQLERQRSPLLRVLDLFGRRISDQQKEDQGERLYHFGVDCWHQLSSEERRYAVPSRGRAELLVPDRVQELFGLRSVRFVQEGCAAPAVFVQFNFGSPRVTGISRISGHSSDAGFHNLVEATWFQIAMVAIAMSYYRDLVLPGDVPSGRTRRRRRSSSGGSPSSSRRNRRRTLPRPQRSRRRSGRTYNLEEWHEAQVRARHSVTGHRRWVGHGFVADPEKQRQAARAGVILPTGYTWVVEHERSNPQHEGRIELDDSYDLKEHTLFRPPAKASEELDRLLA